jgi:hypothetical protein
MKKTFSNKSNSGVDANTPKDLAFSNAENAEAEVIELENTEGWDVGLDDVDDVTFEEDFHLGWIDVPEDEEDWDDPTDVIDLDDCEDASCDFVDDSFFLSQCRQVAQHNLFNPLSLSRQARAIWEMRDPPKKARTSH